MTPVMGLVGVVPAAVVLAFIFDADFGATGPLQIAAFVPVQSLAGRLDWETAVLFAAGSRWFWRFGLRHYTGASA
jgi:hypothetical protein